ncbi:hypothetical protein ACOME3_000678 [Neoechinorhynchus agilis]
MTLLHLFACFVASRCSFIDPKVRSLLVVPENKDPEYGSMLTFTCILDIYENKQIKDFILWSFTPENGSQSNPLCSGTRILNSMQGRLIARQISEEVFELTIKPI